MQCQAGNLGDFGIGLGILNKKVSKIDVTKKCVHRLLIEVMIGAYLGVLVFDFSCRI